jgi:hypothetical protein
MEPKSFDRGLIPRHERPCERIARRGIRGDEEANNLSRSDAFGMRAAGVVDKKKAIRLEAEQN